MKQVEICGAEYGLTLNWNKVEALPVRCDVTLKSTDNKDIAIKDSILYLGALIANDGRISSEFNRRLGLASADFKSLSQCWNHSWLSRNDKYEIYRVLILSKLMYALETAWLSKAEQRKLDGFYCR